MVLYLAEVHKFSNTNSRKMETIDSEEPLTTLAAIAPPPQLRNGS